MFPIFAGNSASTGYNLTRSLRFRASASAYLNRTNTSTVTNNAVWTWSGWAKLGYWSSGNAATLFGTGAGGSANESSIKYVNNQLNVINYVGSSVKCRYITTAVYRDPSAWYHVVVSSNSSTSLRIYINGVQITAFDTATAPDTSAWGVNTASTASYMGWLSGNAYFDGYLTEVNFIDGQALTPSSFGSTNATTGVWQPARYTGTYGTNGFYLPFTDNSALTTSSNVGLGKDFSGNANYWTTNNISITAGVTYDSMTDVPTLTSATASNFCTLNPLDFTTVGTVADGNLKFTQTSAAARSGRGSIGVSSGKWYWEVTNLGGNNSIGIQNAAASLGTYCGGDANGWSYFIDGNKYNNNSGTTYGAAYTTGDVIGVALDLTAGTLTFYKNNTSQGVAYSGLSGTIFPGFSSSTGGGVSFAANFGQRPFTYTPPTGFVALNTYNLPTSTIVKGNTVMDATTYTGNGTSQNVVNAAGFKPDLVWGKSRTNGYLNVLVDSIRGATKYIASNSTAAEVTDAQVVSAFTSTGFSVGNDLSLNQSGSNIVGWQWQAGQGSSSSNTSGTITSTVSVNASAGFSVVTWTGNLTNSTVGHGLGVAPQWIVVKNRTTGNLWPVYHSGATALGYLAFNTTAAYVATSVFWNNTAPTSSVFTVGTTGAVNNTGDAMVAYCWTPIAGYSAFGSYTGNGSTNGPFVYTGFRPRWIMVKWSSGVENWGIIDTARTPYNAVISQLFANTLTAENTDANQAVDILSNGFKLRGSLDLFNNSGGTYIYAAYAENPFKNALAR